MGTARSIVVAIRTMRIHSNPVGIPRRGEDLGRKPSQGISCATFAFSFGATKRDCVAKMVNPRPLAHDKTDIELGHDKSPTVSTSKTWRGIKGVAKRPLLEPGRVFAVTLNLIWWTRTGGHPWNPRINFPLFPYSASRCNKTAWGI